MAFARKLGRGVVVMASAAALGSTVAISGAVWSGTAGAYDIDTSSRAAFIASVAPLAQEGQRLYGVPASVAIAQAILESGWGRSGLTQRGNAFFGIKCSTTLGPYATGCLDLRTREVFNGVPTYITDGFRTYADPADSFKDHGRFLTVNTRYAQAFDHPRDPRRFIAEVHRAGYATDPTYTAMIVELMDSYDLYRFDRSGSTPSPSPTARRSATSTPTPSVTRTVAATPSPSAARTPSRSALTPSSTPMATRSAAPTPSTSPAPTRSITPTPARSTPASTPSPVSTPTPTVLTPVPTPAPSATRARRVTPSARPSPSTSPQETAPNPSAVRATREQDPAKDGALHPDGKAVKVAVAHRPAMATPNPVVTSSPVATRIPGPPDTVAASSRPAPEHTGGLASTGD